MNREHPYSGSMWSSDSSLSSWPAGYGEDGIYFDHSADCRDNIHHRGCAGRWRGVVSLGFGSDGKRIRNKVSGKTRTEVKDKLRGLHTELDAGIRTTRGYTVERAVTDWLADGMPGRAQKTIDTNGDSPQPVLACIGNIPLRDLTAHDVRTALSRMTATHATRTIQKAHNCLTRAIRDAEARDLVRRNVSTLVDTPRGKEGRPSQSLTLEQAAALLQAAEKSRLHAYISLCLLTGVRAEEARALTWQHVDLDAGTVSVRRSVRAHGDTKTERSRRTLKLPAAAVRTLMAHKQQQVQDRANAGAPDRFEDLPGRYLVQRAGLVPRAVPRGPSVAGPVPGQYGLCLGHHAGYVPAPPRMFHRTAARGAARRLALVSAVCNGGRRQQIMS